LRLDASEHIGVDRIMEIMADLQPPPDSYQNISPNNDVEMLYQQLGEPAAITPQGPTLQAYSYPSLDALFFVDADSSVVMIFVSENGVEENGLVGGMTIDEVVKLFGFPHATREINGSPQLDYGTVRLTIIDGIVSSRLFF